jgi:diguanylate cyclase
MRKIQKIEMKMPIQLLIFGKNNKQAVRIERLLLASSTYLFGMFIVNYCRLTGLFPDHPYWSVLGGALALNFIFYILIRSNWNLRCQDPSLTLPQMLVASLVNTYLVFNAAEARGAFLIGYLLILVFGIFKLRRSQFLQIGAIVVLAYGAIILFEFHVNKPGFNMALEILQWLLLVFVYPWFAWVGGYIGDLRRREREANEHLQRALSDKSAAMQLVQMQAACDDLTGLYNRRYMHERMRHEERMADSTGSPFCVLLIDIDHFKQINDSVGHFVGDKVLVRSVSAIKEVLRSSDLFSRWGGEEFLIFMPSIGLPVVRDITSRIHRCVESIDFSDLGFYARVTVSIGVAERHGDESLEDLLSSADKALYRAKDNGRNRSEFRLTSALTGGVIGL